MRGLRLLRGLLARVAAFRERRAAIGTLSEMSDRELADIGLSRGEIGRVFDPEFTRTRTCPAAGERVPANLSRPITRQ